MKKLLIASLIGAAFAAQAATNSTDIIVIGAGSAGMSAAVQAHDLGAKVILLEKMGTPGGNSVRAEGGLNAAETTQQAKMGIKDSIQTMIDDTMKGGHNKNNPELVKVLANNSKGAVDWIVSLGGDLNDVGMMAGATNKRCHRPTGGAPVGAEIVKTLMKAVDSRKIDLRCDTKVVKILRNAAGGPSGVVVQGEDGKTYKIQCKALINAAGGFGANNDMVASYIPRLKGFATTNHPGATGDGLLLAKRLNAAYVDMLEIQTHPTVVESNGVMVTEAVRGNGAILVNTEGKRFCNELLTRDVVAAAVLAQPTKHAFMFFDEDVKNSLKAINGYLKRPGMVIQGSTLEEIAGKMKVPAANLKATMEKYAKFQAANKDEEFGRKSMERPLTKPGYYAISITPAVHHTMGGLKINTKAQVLNTSGKVIPGFFAAGEVTGGVHGGNRLGGNAQCDIVVYGRIAAKSAVEFLKK